MRNSDWFDYLTRALRAAARFFTKAPDRSGTSYSTEVIVQNFEDGMPTRTDEAYALNVTPGGRPILVPLTRVCEKVRAVIDELDMAD